MMNTTAYKRMKSGTPGYTDKTNEDIAFEDLKPYIEQHLKDGGDQATALETAIEQFNTEDSEQEVAKDQAEAEKINTELDRIKALANLS